MLSEKVIILNYVARLMSTEFWVNCRTIDKDTVGGADESKRYDRVRSCYESGDLPETSSA